MSGRSRMGLAAQEGIGNYESTTDVRGLHCASRHKSLNCSWVSKMEK